MGAACSSDDVSFVLTPGLPGQDDIADVLFTQHLKMPPKDLDKFYRLFLKLQGIENDKREKEFKLTQEARERGQKLKGKDKEGQSDKQDKAIAVPKFSAEGKIHKDTMYDYLDIPKTVVNQRLFGFFTDKEFTEEITFVAFVACLWHFLSFSPKWLGHYLFSLFNDNRRPYLSHNQLISLVTTMLDKIAEPVVLRKILKCIPFLAPEVTHVMFQKFIDENPVVYKPFASLQDKLRSKCFGLNFWKKKQKLRFKNKDHMNADYLIKLNEINNDLYYKREMAAEVEERMASWKLQRESQKNLEGAFDDMERVLGPAVDATIPPPSLLVHIQGGPASNDQNRKQRTKKKRKRHSRKTLKEKAKMGPYGGPKEWLGRKELPVLQVPPEVLAALEEKNARKADLKAKRVALRARGRDARIAAEEKGHEKSPEEEKNCNASRPKIKYLPKISPVTKPQHSNTGIQTTRQCYVDNL